jgi:UPF0716 protein FxsA
MPLILLTVLIGLPVLELYVIVRVGEAIGVELTILTLVVTSMLGYRLLRSQGRAVLQRFVGQLRANRPPALEALDGALVFVGGVLLMVPGFVTDAFGVLLLAPPTRGVLRGLIVRHYRSRLLGWVVRRPPAGHDVDATAVEIDHRELPR